MLPEAILKSTEFTEKLTVVYLLFFAIITAMFWNSSAWKKIHTISEIIVWHLLFLVFATIVVDDLASLLITDSRIFRFYAALCAFEPWSAIWYVSNFIQVLLNILIFIPFLFYIYNKNLPFRNLWPWILIGKVFFDISGHYYQFLDCKSLFYLKPSYGIFSALAQIIIWAPSYGAPISLIIQHKSLHAFIKPSPN